MRKLIKIEQVDNNKKYDFVILGNCNSPSYKKFKVCQFNILKYDS
jgi:abnormal spindle-like microcephaly-associated protein